VFFFFFLPFLCAFNVYQSAFLWKQVSLAPPPPHFSQNVMGAPFPLQILFGVDHGARFVTVSYRRLPFFLCSVNFLTASCMYTPSLPRWFSPVALPRHYPLVNFPRSSGFGLSLFLTCFLPDPIYPLPPVPSLVLYINNPLDPNVAGYFLKADPPLFFFLFPNFKSVCRHKLKESLSPLGEGRYCGPPADFHGFEQAPTFFPLKFVLFMSLHFFFWPRRETPVFSFFQLKSMFTGSFPAVVAPFIFFCP